MELTNAEDDILKYIGPSLERHRGCDLLDINPGAGLWSRKLHEVLQPRKHIMLDKDAELYEPFLKDLLAKDNVELLEKSGIVWKDLNEAMGTHLTNQVVPEPGATPERNDTLLVSVNIAMFPRKPWNGFECVSTMVLYQFLSSIKSSSLFQRYGLVRMLFWINDDEKRRVLPRTIVRRRRSAFENELSLEYIHEVAGKDVENEDRTELRDEWINTESALSTIERMKQAGLKMPRGRETERYKTMIKKSGLAGQRLAGERRPELSRPFKEELEQLEDEYLKAVKRKKTTEMPKRLKELLYRDKYDKEGGETFLELFKARDAAFALAQASSPDFAAADQAFNERVTSLKKNPHKEYIVHRDNYHLFRQSPPALFWDRRAYEPLAVRPDDFFPNVECTLLDFQPKAMHPLLRSSGGKSNRLADISDVMLRYWFFHGLLPVSKAMDGVWPGFSDLRQDIASLVDPALGGSPMSGVGELTARSINSRQWEDMIQAMSEWPFAPTYQQIVGRLVDDTEEHVEDDEGTRGHLMASVTGSAVNMS